MYLPTETYEWILVFQFHVQVPFHLSAMGANTLGVYVCQWAFLAVVKNGIFFTVLESLQSKEYFGKGLLSGLSQVCVQTRG